VHIVRKVFSMSFVHGSPTHTEAGFFCAPSMRNSLGVQVSF
jgi:hypothetical protein